jgi:alpha-tubulin suppressor-like RCC1 family protein
MQYACAYLSAGGAKCWGYDGNGQLGNGSSTNSNTPVAVVGAGGVGALTLNIQLLSQTITFGPIPNVALGGSGTVSAAGGASGNPVIFTSTRPGVCTVSGDTVSAIAAGTCIIAANQAGTATYGTAAQVTQIIMIHTPLSMSVPALVPMVSAGSNHTCALSNAGGVQCWGGNQLGQLGSGSTVSSSSAPVAVAGLGSGVVAISTGHYHSCALTSAGGVQCWGLNDVGQLGNGSLTNSSTPVGVTSLSRGVVAVSAGYNHTCALKSTGDVHCWGGNNYGQLGDGSTTSSSTPVGVTGWGSGAVSIGVGSGHSCSVTSMGGCNVGVPITRVS